MIDVHEIMTPRRDLVTLPPEALVLEAGRLMSDKKIRHIPVIDETGELVGIVSHRDVLAATAPKAARPPSGSDGITVADIMSYPVMTVDPRVSVLHAGLRLRSLGVGSLAVVNDGKLEGIITDSDFLSVALSLLEQMEVSEPFDEF